MNHSFIHLCRAAQGNCAMRYIKNTNIASNLFKCLYDIDAWAWKSLSIIICSYVITSLSSRPAMIQSILHCQWCWIVTTCRETVDFTNETCRLLQTSVKTGIKDIHIPATHCSSGSRNSRQIPTVKDSKPGLINGLQTQCYCWR